jgi:microcystin-dependent protein
MTKRAWTVARFLGIGALFMAEPFLSEIRLMSFVFPPKGWALCNGQLLPINQNQALFSLLGTTFGGDGRVNFALPNFQGRTPIHMGAGHTLGEAAGTPSTTLQITQIPQHTHALNASSAQGNSVNPRFGSTGHRLAADPGNCYAPDNSGSLVALNAGSVSTVGGSQSHENMMPYAVVSFCIALQGIFPSQT